MDINKQFVVYELISIMGSDQKSLKKVKFKGWKQNSFESEDEAIQALVDDKLTYQNYVILREIYIN